MFTESEHAGTPAAARRATGAGRPPRSTATHGAGESGSVGSAVARCCARSGGRPRLRAHGRPEIVHAGLVAASMTPVSSLQRSATMARLDISTMKFSKVYPMYVQKAERKNRSRDEVDRVIRWLTGYDQAGLQRQLEQEADFRTFFAQAPALHPNRAQIKGLICGVRIEDIDDPLMRNVRYLDKLVDEIAKGKAIEKILRD
jgi:hypothetical protein